MRSLLRFFKNIFLALIITLSIIAWAMPLVISYSTHLLQKIAKEKYQLIVSTSGVEWQGWNRFHIANLKVESIDNALILDIKKVNAHFSLSHLFLRSLYIKDFNIDSIYFLQTNPISALVDSPIQDGLTDWTDQARQFSRLIVEDLNEYNNKFQSILANAISYYPNQSWSLSCKQFNVNKLYIDDLSDTQDQQLSINGSFLLSRHGKSIHIDVAAKAPSDDLFCCLNIEKLNRQILIKSNFNIDIQTLLDSPLKVGGSLSSRLNSEYLFDPNLREKVAYFFPQHSQANNHYPFESTVSLAFSSKGSSFSQPHEISCSLKYDPQSQLLFKGVIKKDDQDLGNIDLDYQIAGNQKLTIEAQGAYSSPAYSDLQVDNASAKAILKISKKDRSLGFDLNVDNASLNGRKVKNVIGKAALENGSFNKYELSGSFMDDAGVLYHANANLNLLYDNAGALPILKFDKVIFATDELIASGQIDYSPSTQFIYCDLQAILNYDLANLLKIPFLPSKENYLDVQFKGRLQGDIEGKLLASYDQVKHQNIVADQISFIGSLERTSGNWDIETLLELDNVRLGSLYDPKLTIKSSIKGKENLFAQIVLDSLVDSGPSFKSQLIFSNGVNPYITIDSLVSNILGTSIELIDSSTLRWSDGSVTLDPTRLIVGEGSIYGYLNSSKDKLEVDLEIDKIPLFLGSLITTSKLLDGSASLICKGSIGGDEDLVVLDYQLDDISLLHDVSRQSFNLQGKAIYVDKTIHNESTIDLEKGSYNFWTRIPVNLSIDLTRFFLCNLAIDSEREHSFTLIGQGAPLSYLNLIQPYQIFNDGVIEVNAKGSGFGYDYSLTGSASGSGLAYTLQSVDLELKDIEFNGRFEDKRFILDQIKAKNHRRGTIDGSGTIHTSIDSSLTYNASFTINHLRTTPVNQILVESKGELNLEGGLNFLNISGNLQVQSAEVGIPDLITFKNPLLLYDYKGRSLSPGGKPPALPTNFFPLTLDLEIDTRDKVSFEGRGLQSVWGGKLLVKGEIESLSILGTMKMRQGLFTLAGRLFDIQTATIEFVGPPRKALIQVIAALTLPDIIAFAEYSGPILNPTITLKSQPFKTQKEILSLILFGKSLAEITPLESIQLASVLLQLGGSSNNPGNVLGAIGRSVGIDRLDFEGGGDNPVSVSAGKYVSKGVFVNLTKPIYSDANIFSLGVEFRKNVKLQADFSDTDEDRLMIKWQKRYR